MEAEKQGWCSCSNGRIHIPYFPVTHLVKEVFVHHYIDNDCSICINNKLFNKAFNTLYELEEFLDGGKI